MTLVLSKISHNMDALGLALETESARLEDVLPHARDALRTIDLIDDLEDRIQQALDLNWSGAIPLYEPVADTFKLPAHPGRMDIIAADGSQIYPDRHSLALYYLINIGSIVYQHGIDQAPTCNSWPYIFFESNELYDGDHIIGSTEVDTRRDVAEIAELRRCASHVADAVPSIALLDNGLLLHGAPYSRRHHKHDIALMEYLSELDSLQATGVALAGVIDRPRASQVLGLAHLSGLPRDNITQESLQSLGKLVRLSDAMLFRNLDPGERSALFVSGSYNNLKHYQPKKHKVCFFYVNVGQIDGPISILRVEVPEWVAQDSDKMHLVHAAVVEQCRATDGFPYVLIRAHELAVVSTKEHREVDQMAAQAMIRHGIFPRISSKQQGKMWTQNIQDT